MIQGIVRLRSKIFWILFGFWALLVALSTIPPIAQTGYGWSIIVSLNPMAKFFLFQEAASLVAIPLLLVSASRPTHWERWLARLPAILTCVQLTAFGGVTI